MRIFVTGLSVLCLCGCSAQFGITPVRSAFTKEELAAAFKERDESIKALAMAVVELQKKTGIKK